MMSVKYAFSLSLVFCLDSASDASVFAAESLARGLNQPAATLILQGHSYACRLMTWHHDSMISCQATGNYNPGTAFSAIAKNIEINFFLFAGPAALN